jgi:aerobic carbon-monoxide dehydrogenase medium subunit
LPPLIADGACVTVHGSAGGRRIMLEDFFIGPGKTLLRRDEIVTGVEVPAAAPHSASVYIKHGRRKAMELATVGVAVSLTIDGDVCRGIRIVLGAVAPIPIRAKRAEAMLEGHALDPRLIEQAARAAAEDTRPISNVRGSAAYRREMTAVLASRAITEARERIQ